MVDIVPLDYCNEAIALKKKIEGGFLELAEHLTNIRNNNLWQSQWQTWEEFLVELDWSPATASKLISVHERYVLQYNIAPAKLVKTSWSNLYELLPLVTSQETAEEYVHKASVLRREDLREERREALHGVCNHEDEFEVHIWQCRCCGRRRTA